MDLIIEDNIPIPSSARSGRRLKEKEAVKEILNKLQDGQSVFIEHEYVSDTTIRELLREFRESIDMKFISKVQKEPIRGVRVWAKSRKK